MDSRRRHIPTITTPTSMFSASDVQINGGVFNQLTQVQDLPRNATQNSRNQDEKRSHKRPRKKMPKWAEGVMEPGDVIYKDKPDGIIPVVIMSSDEFGVGGERLFYSIITGQGRDPGFQQWTRTLNQALVGIPSALNFGPDRQLLILETQAVIPRSEVSLEALRRVAVWLAHSYASGMEWGGIIYIHDLSQDLEPRFMDRNRRNLEVLRALCGPDALSTIVLTSTGWERIPRDIAEAREKELRNGLWREFIAARASVRRFDNTSESAWEITGTILSKIRHQYHADSLQIQVEIVDLRRKISKTTAGQALAAAEGKQPKKTPLSRFLELLGLASRPEISLEAPQNSTGKSPLDPDLPVNPDGPINPSVP